MATMKQCMVEARIKWGAKAHISDNRRASSDALRDEARQRAAALKSEREAIDAEIKTLGNVGKELAKAARFAIDVDVAEPSWSQLIEATKRAERRYALDERYSAVIRQRREEESAATGYRYSAGQVDFVGLSVFCIEVNADTLDELREKIRAWRPSRRNSNAD